MPVYVQVGVCIFRHRYISDVYSSTSPQYLLCALLSCNAGFHHTDIDECERDTDNCNTNANCSDTEGSFNCTCVTGYEGDGVNCTSKSESNLALNMPILKMH